MFDFEDLKNLETKKLFLISAAIIFSVFVVSLSIFYLVADISSQENSFSTNATVISSEEGNESLYAGLSLGQGLSFGKFDSRLNKTKTLNLSSENLAYVKVDSTGNISEKLSYKRNHLFQGSEQIEVRMEANESGYFEGKVNLDIKAAENNWGARWLDLLYQLS